MKVLFAAGEAAPFIKTGGLADVMQALPEELSKMKDNEITVFIPLYKAIKENPKFELEFLFDFEVRLAWRSLYGGLFRAKTKRKKLQVYFIDNEYYFKRDKAYGDYDDGEKFAYFSKAVLAAIDRLDYTPDIIHCNDWQTALIPVFLRAEYSHRYSGVKTVYTIHNIEYQGKAPLDFFKNVIGLDPYWLGVLRFDDCLNFTKAAIEVCDRFTTVSRTHAEEIQYQYHAHGLADFVRNYSWKLTGIVNGINPEIFNPMTDVVIPAKYSASDMSGKAICKAELQKELGLAQLPDTPIIAMVTRLVDHKGLDLLKYLMDELMRWNVQIVILGTGDAQYEDFFRRTAEYHPDKLSVNLKFDAKLASRIYAGSDIYLMPSKSEPCGLSQLIAMRYGTVPLVRETGGLKDTVAPLNPMTMQGSGFTFKSYNAHDMLDAITRCVTFYYDTEHWAQLRRNIMEYDSSWKQPALEYMAVYNKILGK